MCFRVNKEKKMLKYGDRNSVWNDEAKQTRGGLTKEDLIMSKSGKIVSKKKSESARAWYEKNGGFKRKAVQQQTPDPTPTPAEPPKKKRKYRRRKKNKEE